MPQPRLLIWLPDEIVLYLLMTVDIESLLQLRQVGFSFTSRLYCSLKAEFPFPTSQTCKRIFSISRAKQLWVKIYFRYIVHQALPFAPYWKDIDELTARKLERLVSHVLRLNRRLCLHSPPIARSFNQRRSVTWVRLVQSQWLLVASSDDVTSAITLWSITSLLTSKSLAPLTEAYLSAPVITGAVDVAGSSVTLALELCGRSVRMWLL